MSFRVFLPGYETLFCYLSNFFRNTVFHGGITVFLIINKIKSYICYRLRTTEGLSIYIFKPKDKILFRQQVLFVEEEILLSVGVPMFVGLERKC